LKVRVYSSVWLESFGFAAEPVAGFVVVVGLIVICRCRCFGLIITLLVMTCKILFQFLDVRNLFVVVVFVVDVIFDIFHYTLFVFDDILVFGGNLWSARLFIVFGSVVVIIAVIVVVVVVDINGILRRRLSIGYLLNLLNVFVIQSSNFLFLPIRSLLKEVSQSPRCFSHPFFFRSRGGRRGCGCGCGWRW